MDPLTVIAASIGAVGIACAIPAALGLLVLRRLRDKAPESPALAHLTPAGLLLLVSFVALLLAGTATRFLAPQSEVGSLLGTGLGMTLCVGALWLACIAIATALHLLGYPVYKTNPDSQSGRPT